MQRGRPRHNDLLTPREWEVLDLLRQGYSNDEIAARLGISVNGAKYHVSEIITKLGVRSRREAAEQPVQPRSRGFGWPGLLAGSVARGLAAVILVVAAIGFVLLAAGVAIDRLGGGQAALIPTPGGQPTEQAARPSPSPSPSATPSPIFAPTGVPIPVWVYADTVAAGNDCQELIGDMIPSSAPPGVPGKTVDCTLEMPYRLILHQGRDGAYHLQYISLLLLLTGDFPTPMPGAPPAEIPCASVTNLFVQATRPPSEATHIGQCAIVPPIRGEGSSEMRIWARIENQLAPESLPADIPCWQTIRYLGAPRDGDLDLRDVTCVLEVP